MEVETTDGTACCIMLGVIGPPGLALFLGWETVGLCLRFCVNFTPYSFLCISAKPSSRKLGPQSHGEGVVLTSRAMRQIYILLKCLGCHPVNGSKAEGSSGSQWT